MNSSYGIPENEQMTEAIELQKERKSNFLEAVEAPFKDLPPGESSLRRATQEALRNLARLTEKKVSEMDDPEEIFRLAKLARMSGRADSTPDPTVEAPEMDVVGNG